MHIYQYSVTVSLILLSTNQHIASFLVDFSKGSNAVIFLNIYFFKHQKSIIY